MRHYCQILENTEMIKTHEENQAVLTAAQTIIVAYAHLGGPQNGDVETFVNALGGDMHVVNSIQSPDALALFFSALLARHMLRL
jgi:hypothetical protein